jgi:hypothetical protein
MLVRCLTVAVVLLSASLAFACPFCSTQGQTLAGELASADMIVVATLKSSEQDPNDFTKSKSVFKIDQAIKPHPVYKAGDTFTVARYIQQVKKGEEPKLLLFCYVNHDPADAQLAAVASAAVFAGYRNVSVDAYRGDEIKPDSTLPKYLADTFALRDKDAATRLKFYFDHLETPELFVSTDALMEFGNADYKDVRPVAEKLPADTLLKWIKDPNTAPSRFGLYGMLLGHCGKAEHAAAIRKLIDDPDNAFSLGLDGMLAGYTLLDPKGGWELIRGIAADRKRDFSTRYAALRTVRFFHEHRAGRDQAGPVARRDEDAGRPGRHRRHRHRRPAEVEGVGRDQLRPRVRRPGDAQLAHHQAGAAAVRHPGGRGRQGGREGVRGQGPRRQPGPGEGDGRTAAGRDAEDGDDDAGGEEVSERVGGTGFQACVRTHRLGSLCHRNSARIACASSCPRSFPFSASPTPSPARSAGRT